MTFNDLRRVSELRDQQARTDDLTGLSNRREFYSQLNETIERCRVRGEGFNHAKREGRTANPSPGQTQRRGVELTEFVAQFDAGSRRSGSPTLRRTIYGGRRQAI